jgi:hypothetical protein
VKSLLLALVLLPTAALATVDPDPDQIGVYFDLEADVTCLDALPSLPFYGYVTITNPTDEVWAASFCLEVRTPPGYEGLMFTMATIWPEPCYPPIQPVEYGDCILGGHYVCPDPITPTGDRVIVMTFHYLLLEIFPVEFYLTPADYVPYPGLGYEGAGGQWVSLGLSTGSPDLPVAQLNGDCSVVAAEAATFGRMKAMYR